MAIPNLIFKKMTGSGKNDVTDEYNRIVSYLIKSVFKSDTDTTDVELNTVAKKLFGSEFGGVYPEDAKVKFDKKHSYYIFNTDKASGGGVHWLGIYVDHTTKSVYVFDTFDRETSKLVPDLYVDIKHNHFRIRKGAHHIHQKDCQLSCGQRSISYLMLVKKFGIKKVMDSNF